MKRKYLINGLILLLVIVVVICAYKLRYGSVVYLYTIVATYLLYFLYGYFDLLSKSVSIQKNRLYLTTFVTGSSAALLLNSILFNTYVYVLGLTATTVPLLFLFIIRWILHRCCEVIKTVLCIVYRCIVYCVLCALFPVPCLQ